MSAGEWADNRAAREYTMTAGLCCRALESRKSCGCVVDYSYSQTADACTRDRASEWNANVSQCCCGEMLFSFSPALRWFILYALLVFSYLLRIVARVKNNYRRGVCHCSALSVEAFSFLSSAMEAIASFIRLLRRWRYFCFTGTSLALLYRFTQLSNYRFVSQRLLVAVTVIIIIPSPKGTANVQIKLLRRRFRSIGLFVQKNCDVTLTLTMHAIASLLFRFVCDRYKAISNTTSLDANLNIEHIYLSLSLGYFYRVDTIRSLGELPLKKRLWVMLWITSIRKSVFSNRYTYIVTIKAHKQSSIFQAKQA